MNLKLRLNKILEGGLRWQILLFTLINAVVFTIAITVYFMIGSDRVTGVWDALRLFVDSNSILDYTHSFSCVNVVLLVLECLGTILFSGLIVSIITNVISLKVDAIKEGHVHYALKGHVVIIGYDSMVPSIISEIIKDKRHKDCYIVLQTSDSLDEVRETLLTKLTGKELKRVILIHAPRLSAEELRLLYTTNVREIYIVGDRTENDHDAENMHTFEELVRIHKERKVEERKPLTVWFEIEASYAALQLNDVSGEWKQYFDFTPYNFYKRWANCLLTRSQYGEGVDQIVYPELDHDGIGAESTKHVHLIVVGMNRMGIALAKEAAHVLHFPNFDDKTSRGTTRITFIDDNADREKNFFIGRLPGYFKVAPVVYADLTDKDFGGFEITVPQDDGQDIHNFLDVRFEFIRGRIESHFVREWLCEALRDDDAIISIAICLENPSKSFGASMYLPEEVYLRGRDDQSRPWEVTDKDKVVNVFVRQVKTGALIKAFGDMAKSESAANKRYANLYPFGMVDESFSLNYYSNHLAMTFNYIYDYYFAHNGVLPSSIPSREELTSKWKKLTTALQWSNLYLADSVEFKLRAIGQDMRDPKHVEIGSYDKVRGLSFTHTLSDIFTTRR